MYFDLTPSAFRRVGDDAIGNFRVAGVWTVQEWSHNITNTKNTGIFNGFTNLELIKFKVPVIYLATGCVS